MKPPRTPLSHHLLLLKPPSSSISCSISCSPPNPNHKSPLYSLVSYLLTLNSTRTLSSPPLNPQDFGSINTHLHNSTFSDLTTPSSNSQSNDFGYTHKSNSLEQSKPTIKTNFKSNFLSPNLQTDEPINAFLLCLSKKSKPIIQTPLHDQVLSKFAQKRSFSAGPSGPFNPIPVVSTVDSPLESSPTIDAGSSIRKPVSLWPGMYHSPVTNALWEARSCIFESLSNAPTDSSQPQSELISKTPSQSRTTILYKFSSDYILREQYRNPWNEIRMGKLLEDLDALAGTISYKFGSMVYHLVYPMEKIIPGATIL